MANLRKGEPQWQAMVGTRVLSDSHFEFRGGPVTGQAMRRAERRMLHREE